MATTKPIQQALTQLNELATMARLDRSNSQSVDPGEALAFAKGYIRALDEFALISKSESLALRAELRSWPAPLSLDASEPDA